MATNIPGGAGLESLANKIFDDTIGVWTPRELPRLRNFHARISQLEAWAHVSREVEAFGRVLAKAEYLAKVYGTKEAEAVPPELARTMVEVHRALEDLHHAVQSKRFDLEQTGRSQAATASSSSPNSRSTIHSALNGI